MADQAKLGDVEELNLSVARAGVSKAATITRIEMTTAGAVFGDKTRTREGETLETAKARAVAKVYFEGEGFAGNEPFNLPGPGGIRPKSKLWDFISRYGAQPKKGMSVSAHMNENGLYELDL